MIILVCCAVAMWTSEKRWSMTADEPVHLMRGHAYWWTESARLSSAHPPLSNAITSLPFSRDGDEPWQAKRPEGPTRAEYVLNSPKWGDANPLPLAMQYLTIDFDGARAELTWARRIMISWTLVFLGSLYAWCDRRWGFTTAILALLLAATHPTLLAHGQLITTDFAATATTFWLVIAWIAWIERPSVARIGWFTLAGTAMVLTKHSGLVLMFVSAPVVLASAWFGWGGFARQTAARWRRAATTGLWLLAVACVMLFALAAAYRFESWGMRVDEILAAPEPRNWIAKRNHYEMFELTPIAALPGWLRLPVPYDWLAGLATVAAQNHMGHGGYFFGIQEQAWHPLYFPVVLAAKTPTGLVVLLGAALWFGVHRKVSVATRVLLLVFVVILGGACLSRINIGVRHVLPAVPILIVFAARAGALLWARATRPAQTLVVGCLLANLAGAASTFPHWLGDFNALVGGPKGGHEISMVGEDWGQDVEDLVALADERGWKRIDYATSFAPRRLRLRAAGIAVVKLGCNKPTRGRYPIVIHATDWIRRRDSCYSWLGEPDIVINHHILVFEPWAEIRPVRPR